MGGWHTLREGLLPRAMVEGGGCLVQISAGVTGEGGASLNTLGVASEWFSWELEGSSASLLGTGVTLAGFRLARVVSLRHGDESTADLAVDDGGAGELFWGALEKKPRMLFCCLPPVDDMELVFLASEGVLGVGLPAMMGGGVGCRDDDSDVFNSRHGHAA